MKAQKLHLVLGFLVAGVFFLFGSIFLSLNSTNKSQTVVGRIERETGKVTVLKNSLRQKTVVEKSLPLENLTIVETDDTGEALVSFENLYRIRIFENSAVGVEQRNLSIHLILQRGNLRIENFGEENQLFVLKSGQKFTASDFNSLDQQSFANESRDSKSTQNQFSNTQIQSNDLFQSDSTPQGLTDDEISAELNSHKNYFFKCYTQLLQKQLDAKGDVMLNFTIENNGKISTSEVTSNQIQNPIFFKCLKEAIQRIEFKSFSGPSISTFFPLKFE